MRKGWIILILSFFLFVSVAVSAVSAGDIITPTGEKSDLVYIELGDVEFTASDFNFKPGSEIPLWDPIAEIDGKIVRVAWLSNVEPVEATWTFYDPSLHKVHEIHHVPALKKQGSFTGSDGSTYTWLFADSASFTIPCFAGKGNWWASPSYKMADTTTMKGAYDYYGMPVTDGGNIIDNWFFAPWYALGIQFPALFWFPLCLLWIPAIFVIGCIIFTKSAGGFIRVLSGAKAAAKEARGEYRAAGIRDAVIIAGIVIVIVIIALMIIFL